MIAINGSSDFVVNFSWVSQFWKLYGELVLHFTIGLNEVAAVDETWKSKLIFDIRSNKPPADRLIFTPSDGETCNVILQPHIDDGRLLVKDTVYVFVFGVSGAGVTSFSIMVSSGGTTVKR